MIILHDPQETELLRRALGNTGPIAKALTCVDISSIMSRLIKPYPSIGMTNAVIEGAWSGTSAEPTVRHRH